MSALWNSKSRMIWCVASAIGTVFFVGIDWLLREWANQTGLAPTASDLWLSVGLGMALGLISMVWEYYQLRYKREFLFAFHRTPVLKRFTWKHQGTNLLLNGWLLVAILALIAWCYYTGVFLLPALFAMNAVLFMGNGRAAEEFNAELRKVNANSAA